ncbi:MAG: hypothetical protein LBB61_07965 [Treponema sp.]|nr:hypothetical protein [Treponema sp.]
MYNTKTQLSTDVYLHGDKAAKQVRPHWQVRPFGINPAAGAVWSMQD